MIIIDSVYRSPVGSSMFLEAKEKFVFQKPNYTVVISGDTNVKFDMTKVGFYQFITVT